MKKVKLSLSYEIEKCLKAEMFCGMQKYHVLKTWKNVVKIFKDFECIVQIEYLKCYFLLFRVIWWMKNRFCYKISFSITNLGFSSYQKLIVFYRLDLITNFEGNLCKKAGLGF